jgi:hypothetical protein
MVSNLFSFKDFPAFGKKLLEKYGENTYEEMRVGGKFGIRLSSTLYGKTPHSPRGGNPCKRIRTQRT